MHLMPRPHTTGPGSLFVDAPWLAGIWRVRHRRCLSTPTLRNLRRRPWLAERSGQVGNWGGVGRGAAAYMTAWIFVPFCVQLPCFQIASEIGTSSQASCDFISWAVYSNGFQLGTLFQCIYTTSILWSWLHLILFSFNYTLPGMAMGETQESWPVRFQAYLPGTEVTMILKVVPPGRGLAIALRQGWPLRSPQMWVTRVRNLC